MLAWRTVPALLAPIVIMCGRYDVHTPVEDIARAFDALPGDEVAGMGARYNPAIDDQVAIANMLAPFPAEQMRAYPVSTRVNNVKSDAPDLIEAASA